MAKPHLKLVTPLAVLGTAEKIESRFHYFFSLEPLAHQAS
jgi:hypothetical protein